MRVYRGFGCPCTLFCFGDNSMSEKPDNISPNEIVGKVANVLYLLAACGPLYIIRLMVMDISGKTTSVSIQIAATIGVTIVGLSTLFWYLSKRKSDKQAEELIRLRVRCEDLEKMKRTDYIELVRSKAEVLELRSKVEGPKELEHKND